MAIEPNTDEDGNKKDNWITDEELREDYPELWQVAREKMARIEAAWTPEFREALRKRKSL